jgi:hypothetical protein
MTERSERRRAAVANYRQKVKQLTPCNPFSRLDIFYTHPIYILYRTLNLAMVPTRSPRAFLSGSFQADAYAVQRTVWNVRLGSPSS